MTGLIHVHIGPFNNIAKTICEESLSGEINEMGT
jgi:hypothetical protein